ncbi:hypothetical protein M427DRAFT_153181 [Gonapodya prolifera JEL478]|uniref:Uncharacterized protein n=1 Tax=Gonapodya prolifera (strain JEL478) TaxID=1344416 RepID=A0A139APF7_GONPJ|nr:hypothetical protein M427DRAFT_153181 [Gonapodya prolifera JEL478]|eukprot:KXS18393.1 hypothetical protein M427DRAFT_153181 [Gonapodya prolifera JEL478]
MEEAADPAGNISPDVVDTGVQSSAITTTLSTIATNSSTGDIVDGGNGSTAMDLGEGPSTVADVVPGGDVVPAPGTSDPTVQTPSVSVTASEIDGSSAACTGAMALEEAPLMDDSTTISNELGAPADEIRTHRLFSLEEIVTRILLLSEPSLQRTWRLRAVSRTFRAASHRTIYHLLKPPTPLAPLSTGGGSTQPHQPSSSFPILLVRLSSNSNISSLKYPATWDRSAAPLFAEKYVKYACRRVVGPQSANPMLEWGVLDEGFGGGFDVWRNEVHTVSDVSLDLIFSRLWSRPLPTSDVAAGIPRWSMGIPLPPMRPGTFAMRNVECTHPHHADLNLSIKVSPLNPPDYFRIRPRHLTLSMRLLFSTARGLAVAQAPRYKDVVGRREVPASGPNSVSPSPPIVPWPVAEGTPVWDGRCRHMLSAGGKLGRYVIQVGAVVAERSQIELPVTLAELVADPSQVPPNQRPAVSTLTPSDHAVVSSGATQWVPVVYSVHHAEDKDETSVARKKVRRGTGMERLARLVNDSLATNGSRNDSALSPTDVSMFGAQSGASLSALGTGVDPSALALPLLVPARDTSQATSDNEGDVEVDAERGLVGTEDDDRDGDNDDTEGEFAGRKASVEHPRSSLSDTPNCTSADAPSPPAKACRVARTVLVVMCKKEKDKDREKSDRDKGKEHRAERDRDRSEASSRKTDVVQANGPARPANEGTGSSSVETELPTRPVTATIGVQTDSWHDDVTPTHKDIRERVSSPVPQMLSLPIALLLAFTSALAVLMGVIVGIAIGKGIQ